MNFGDVLDVAIGLALTYFLASLVASAIKEMVANVMQWRGRFLQQGLRVLLSTETGAAFSYGPLNWLSRLIQWVLRQVQHPPPVPPAVAKVQSVLTHTLIRGTPTKRPSYIPAHDFSAALFDKLRDVSSGAAVITGLVRQVKTAVDALPAGAIKTELTTLFQQPGGNPDLISHVATTLAALPDGTLKTNLTALVQADNSDLSALGDRVAHLTDSDFKEALTALITFVRQPGGDLAAVRAAMAAVPAGGLATALTTFIDQSGGDLDLLTQVKATVAALPDCDIKSALTAFIQQSGDDLEELRTRIELWFDDAMDRLSGIYRRFAQYVLFGLGLAIAVGLNVDTVQLANALWTQPPLRAAMVAQATTAIASQDPTKSPAWSDAETNLNSLPVPIGRKAGTSLFGVTVAADVRWWSCWAWWSIGWNWWALVGWLISAFAISLGAPFWFDTLKGALSMRAAGPQPPRSDAPAASS